MSQIAIIGSGPTAIYTLSHLLTTVQPLDMTIFEAQAEAGMGTPNHPGLNIKTILIDGAPEPVFPAPDRKIAQAQIVGKVPAYAKQDRTGGA